MKLLCTCYPGVNIYEGNSIFGSTSKSKSGYQSVHSL